MHHHHLTGKYVPLHLQVQASLRLFRALAPALSGHPTAQDPEEGQYQERKIETLQQY